MFFFNKSFTIIFKKKSLQNNSLVKIMKSMIIFIYIISLALVTHQTPIPGCLSSSKMNFFLIKQSNFNDRSIRLYTVFERRKTM